MTKAGEAIFSEPPEDLDETWTHGALMGGMAGYSDETLAPAYFSAGAALIDHVLQSEERGQDFVCPILYLYRHGIELYLKVIVQPSVRNHSLGSLLEGFCRHIRERYKEDVPAWVTRPITELAEFDPGSDLFRYGRTNPPSRSQRLTNEGEFWVDLKTLKRTMTLIEFAVRRTLAAGECGLDDLDRIVPGPRVT